jgi:hypothetical protein
MEGHRVIKKTFKNLLQYLGVGMHKQISDDKILSLLKQIRPKKTLNPLIRVGNKEDGGYLVPDILTEITLCFSPGVASRYTFEQDLYHNHKIKSHLCDNTVNMDTSLDFLASFTKKHLGTVSDNDTQTLTKWIHNQVDENAKLLLQMDIEGAELPVILSTDNYILSKFKIIILEVHFLEQMKTPSGFLLYKLFFEKLCNEHVPVHLHCNNNGGTFLCGGEAMPRVIELTLLRDDLKQKFEDYAILPHKLDSLNRPNGAPIPVPSIWLN